MIYLSDRFQMPRGYKRTTDGNFLHFYLIIIYDTIFVPIDDEKFMMILYYVGTSFILDVIYCILPIIAI